MSNEMNITWHAGHVGVEERAKVLKQKGVTVWMTGLSASGKSTIASILEQMLIHGGHAAYRLDGDNIRFGLNKDPKTLTQSCGYSDVAAARFGLGFAAEDRTENIRRIGEVAKLFVDAGLITITSFISPYIRDRDYVRSLHREGTFIEVMPSLVGSASSGPRGPGERSAETDPTRLTFPGPARHPQSPRKLPASRQWPDASVRMRFPLVSSGSSIARLRRQRI